jgi:hypothetical protein
MVCPINFSDSVPYLFNAPIHKGQALKNQGGLSLLQPPGFSSTVLFWWNIKLVTASKLVFPIIRNQEDGLHWQGPGDGWPSGLKRRHPPFAQRCVGWECPHWIVVWILVWTFGSNEQAEVMETLSCSGLCWPGGCFCSSLQGLHFT